MQSRSIRTQIHADRILEELARLAFGDITNIVKIENGMVIISDTSELTEDQSRTIAEISETISDGGRTKRLKTYDKQRALELLGKHVGLFRDKLELTGANGGPVQVDDSKRVVFYIPDNNRNKRTEDEPAADN